MKLLESCFVTGRRPFPPRHLPSPIDRENFRDGSWFRRLIAVRPGAFVVPSPEGPEVYDPSPPARLLKGEPVDPRRYLGRVHEEGSGVITLTLWEVPNGRELLTNVSRDLPGVTVKGRMGPGMPVDLWTWGEFDRDGRRSERLLLQAARATRSRR